MAIITPMQRYACEASITADGLQAWRVANGLSRSAFAHRLGFSTRAVLMWEDGARRIPCWMDRATEEISAEIATQKRRPEAARLQHGTVARRR